MLTTPTAEQAAQRITEALEKGPSLHNQVMNLKCDSDDCPLGGVNALLAFKSGHRDARHEAAELVAAHEADLRALLAERAEWSDRTAEAQAERDAAREERAELLKDAARLRAKLDALDNLPAEDFIRKVAQQMGPPPFDTWPVSHVCQQNADEALELVSEYDRLAALTTKDTQ